MGRRQERAPYWTDDKTARGDIAKIIRAARKGKRLTQSSAAGAIGVKRSMWAQWETGRKNLTVPKWGQVAEILELQDYKHEDTWSNNGSDRIITRLYKPKAARTEAKK